MQLYHGISNDSVDLLKLPFHSALVHWYCCLYNFNLIRTVSVITMGEA